MQVFTEIRTMTLEFALKCGYAAFGIDRAGISDVTEVYDLTKENMAEARSKMKVGDRLLLADKTPTVASIDEQALLGWIVEQHEETFNDDMKEALLCAPNYEEFRQGFELINKALSKYRAYDMTEIELIHTPTASC